MSIEGYLLDTVVASAVFDVLDKDHKEITNHINQLGDDDRIYICAATLGEIEFGMKIALKADDTRQRTVREAMAQYECKPIDPHASEIYSNIRAKLFEDCAPKDSRGRIKNKYVESLCDRTTGLALGIQENDLWIVSVAINFNLIFATRDHGGGMTKILEAGKYIHRTEYW